MKIKPVIEQYIYEKSHIQVGVRINYTKKEISLVEHDGRNKEWVFVNRGLDYIQGWQNILSVTKEAISHAQGRLKAYEDKSLEDFAQIVYAVQAKEEEKENDEQSSTKNH